MNGGPGDAVGTASGEGDGVSLGTLAGVHAATESTMTARRPVLIDVSLSMAAVCGPIFAVVKANRYQFTEVRRCPHAV
jgi:hypothetical protein